MHFRGSCHQACPGHTHLPLDAPPGLPAPCLSCSPATGGGRCGQATLRRPLTALPRPQGGRALRAGPSSFHSDSLPLWAHQTHSHPHLGKHRGLHTVALSMITNILSPPPRLPLHLWANSQPLCKHHFLREVLLPVPTTCRRGRHYTWLTVFPLGASVPPGSTSALVLMPPSTVRGARMDDPKI